MKKANKQITEEKKDPIYHFGFNKDNYKCLFIVLGINVLGFFLMIGGGADSTEKFDGDALFSHTRITLAPILILIGYGVILYAIMKPNKKNSNPE